MALETSKLPVQAVGNYDIVEKIAEGGMGAIYKGRHRGTGQVVAIKIMPQHMASNQVLVKRFEQEFNAANKLNHPNIVRALEYGTSDNSTPFLVLEFVDGESLGRKIHREGKLPEAEAIRLIVQVAQGLYRAHKQGMIHRDVKPDNVLVTRDGMAKLADLGLVKEVDAELNLTKTGRGLGTPHFMAPEQFRDAKNADERCDIYSLGATLYQMVTGELPFKSTGPLDAWMKKMNNDLVPPRTLVPELSERTDEAIRRAMDPKPEKRPATCREFVEDLTGQSTRKPTAPDSAAPPQDLWYLVYQDEAGEPHTVKGSTAAIRHSLTQGLLGDAGNIRACRTKTGTFEPLRAFPEFRDLLVTPAPATPPATAAAPAPSRPASRASSSAMVVPPAATPKQPSLPNAPVDVPPQIDLPTTSPQSLEWLKWLGLGIVVAVLTGVAAYFLWMR